MREMTQDAPYPSKWSAARTCFNQACQRRVSCVDNEARVQLSVMPVGPLSDRGGSFCDRNQPGHSDPWRRWSG